MPDLLSLLDNSANLVTTSLPQPFLLVQVNHEYLA